MLHLRLLGNFQVASDDTSLTTLASGRVQALLARLALHAGVPQPRAQLAYLFWPDSPEDRARGHLRKLVYELRRALPDAERFLAAAGATLAWRADAPYTLDVAEFEAAAAAAETPAAIARAAALYGGDLLPGCYDDWIAPERERLRRAFAHLLERGIARCEEERDYATALAYAQRLRAHDPP